MKVTMITGGSKGLGAALAKHCMHAGHHVISLARTYSTELEQLAKLTKGTLEQIQLDLIDVKEAEKTFTDLLQRLSKQSVTAVHLINNAGTIVPTKPISQVTGDEITDHVALNLTTPIILTSLFTRFFREQVVPKKIVQISSGAGRNPYYGWSNYCATKAGLDHFTRAVAVEEIEQDAPVHILSIAPGVVDTDMQQYIRNKEASDFKDVNRFIQLKEQGQLATPEHAAELILKVMMDDTVPNGAIIDIRNRN